MGRKRVYGPDTLLGIDMVVLCMAPKFVVYEVLKDLMKMRPRGSFRHVAAICHDTEQDFNVDSGWEYLRAAHSYFQQATRRIFCSGTTRRTQMEESIAINSCGFHTQVVMLLVVSFLLDQPFERLWQPGRTSRWFARKRVRRSHRASALQ